MFKYMWVRLRARGLYDCMNVCISLCRYNTNLQLNHTAEMTLWILYDINGTERYAFYIARPETGNQEADIRLHADGNRRIAADWLAKE